MMDYKKIFKTESSRKRILEALNFIPDKTMVKIQYRIKLNRKLNLKNPQRYSEKLQWYKLYYRNPLMSVCADKFDVRDYVKSKGLAHILNENYGVYDSADDIDYDVLPTKFILKDTLGGGGRSMLFVTDKDELDIEQAKTTMQQWTNAAVKKKSLGREWVYQGKKHRIIAEKYLEGDESGDLPDYKFFCFNGRVFCSYHMVNYTMHHEEGILGFLDRDFNLLPAHRADFKAMTVQPPKPKNYEKMVEMAECLSEGFPHVRVDFYNIDGKIVFGEMTFFNASGYTIFEPDEFDFELGKQFVLPEMKQKDCKEK